MPDQRIFNVATSGLKAEECHAIRSMFRLLDQQQRVYHLVEPDHARADIALVGADDSRAIDHWRRCWHAVPTLFVTSGNDATDDTHLRRPLTFSRLIGALDRITVKNFKYVPGLLIQDGDPAGPGVTDRLSNTARSVMKSGYLALVVDDSAVLRKLMEIELNLFGIEALFADNGEMALQLGSHTEFDIVFLDVMLPGIDGYQVCKTLRSDTRHKKTPIGMLTGKGSTIDKVKGALAGCDFYLPKPVNPETIHATLRKLLPGLDLPGARLLGVVNRLKR
jgi:two-component system, cell cycle response regulator